MTSSIPDSLRTIKRQRSLEESMTLLSRRETEVLTDCVVTSCSHSRKILGAPIPQTSLDRKTPTSAEAYPRDGLLLFGARHRGKACR